MYVIPIIRKPQWTVLLRNREIVNCTDQQAINLEEACFQKLHVVLQVQLGSSHHWLLLNNSWKNCVGGISYSGDRWKFSLLPSYATYSELLKVEDLPLTTNSRNENSARHGNFSKVTSIKGVIWRPCNSVCFICDSFLADLSAGVGLWKLLCWS